MLTGRVTGEREAVVQVQVLGPEGQVRLVEATIDTGYNGFLTLPAPLIRDLTLPFAGAARATLGDGNEVKLDLFLATVVWEKEPCEVLVLAAEGGVLLGMAMLVGSRVTLDVEDDGAITIEALATVRSVH
ncbi:MAG TPA: clan AA aspartic protease [Thermoanaerobaculia bacterium]|jgi:clan AA aspartic protease|nr:clan AA aspartic protease [Thermoanaerobaculia bacterium]